MNLFGQAAYPVRLDWGPTGARACAADLSIVVDVLTFSTAVTVAVERGAEVFPCPWRDPRAHELARTHDAVVAVGRLEGAKADEPAPSLSPAGLLDGPMVPRLVLPSPNGSTIAAALADAGARVAVGCLRNASAAAALASRFLAQRASVLLVAAGERWEADASLRPALEDHLGAGAIAQVLRELGHAHALSPEAAAAADLFTATRPALAATLRSCVGGRELTERGFADDVEVAGALDASAVVPVLRQGRFVALTDGPGHRPD